MNNLLETFVVDINTNEVNLSNLSKKETALLSRITIKNIKEFAIKKGITLSPLEIKKKVLLEDLAKKSKVIFALRVVNSEDAEKAKKICLAFDMTECPHSKVFENEDKNIVLQAQAQCKDFGINNTRIWSRLEKR